MLFRSFVNARDRVTLHQGIDAQATITSGTRLTAYVWYDNEVGYSCQVLRIAEQMCGVSYAKIPAQTVLLLLVVMLY